MIQHLWTLPCRVSLVDTDSSNISLIQILEELTIPAAMPPVPNRAMIPAIFDVVSVWAREAPDQPETGRGKTTIISPAGAALVTNEYEVDLREAQRFRSMGRFLGFPTQGSGRYGIRVERLSQGEDRWEEVAVVPIWVTIAQREIPSPTQADGGPCP